MQWRYRSVNSPRLNHGAHIAEEQRQQQGTDVSAVDVSISHQNNLAVTGGRNIKSASTASPYHLDDGGAFSVMQHVGGGSLLHVKDLATNRQQSLVFAIARIFGGTQRRVTLNDKQLRGSHVVATAVS